VFEDVGRDLACGDADFVANVLRNLFVLAPKSFQCTVDLF